MPVAYRYARAQEILFGQEPGPLLSSKLNRWLHEQHLEKTGYKVSLTNLNRDQLPELILRLQETEGSCPRLSGCTHFILADTDEGLFTIGEFRASKVSTGELYKGVRDLIVCNDPWNDFECLTYRWSPETSSYLPSEK